jgi:hypothetical protein
LGVAIQFIPPQDVPLIVLVTPFPAPREGPGSSEWVRHVAARAQAAFLEAAVEENVPIQSLEGPGCKAMYVSATDKTVKKPIREDFRYGTQGGAEIGGLLATFTILSNVKDTQKTAAALAIIQSAIHVPPR